MLPFLNKKKIVQAVSSRMSPKGNLEPEHEESESMGLVSAADDILAAIAAKDAHMLAEAIQAAFEICEEMPHEEGPHIGEE